MTMRACALALALSAAAAACGPRAPAPATAFQGRLADWTAELAADEPEAAETAGLSAPGVGAALADRSAFAVEARRNAALRRRVELLALDAAQLEGEEHFVYEVLDANFAAAGAAAAYDYGDFSALAGPRPYVLDHRAAAFITLPAFLGAARAPASFEEAEAHVARLGALAGAVDAETARAQADAGRGLAPPGFIIDAALERLRALISAPPSRQLQLDRFARGLDALAGDDAEARARAAEILKSAETIARERFAPALARAAAALSAMRPGASEEAGVSRLPDGAAYYRDALRFETGAELTPEQVHRIGLDRIGALTPQLDIALRRLGMTEGPVGARLAALGADPRHVYADDNAGRAALIGDTRARIARVIERAPRWFAAMPQAPLEVRPAPAYEEAAAPALRYVPPAPDGESAGVFYVNMTARFSRLDLPARTFGEGAPGDHFEAALRFERTREAPLRRLVGFSAYREGWRAYAQELAEELGFVEGDAIGRIGLLQAQLRRAASAVADTGLHARGWSRQRAIDYLVETVGEAPDAAGAAVDLMVVRPGHACAAEIGRREIVALREEARTALGPDFDLGAFHELVLGHAEAPMPSLARLVRDWIPNERARARRRS